MSPKVQMERDQELRKRGHLFEYLTSNPEITLGGGNFIKTCNTRSSQKPIKTKTIYTSNVEIGPRGVGAPGLDIHFGYQIFFLVCVFG